MFNRIEPSKEERIQSVLSKPDGPLARLIPCSTIESANSAAGIREFLPPDAGALAVVETVRLPNVYL